MLRKLKLRQNNSFLMKKTFGLRSYLEKLITAKEVLLLIHHH